MRFSRQPKVPRPSNPCLRIGGRPGIFRKNSVTLGGPGKGLDLAKFRSSLGGEEGGRELGRTKFQSLENFEATPPGQRTKTIPGKRKGESEVFKP